MLNHDQYGNINNFWGCEVGPVPGPQPRLGMRGPSMVLTSYQPQCSWMWSMWIPHSYKILTIYQSLHPVYPSTFATWGFPCGHLRNPKSPAWHAN
ncbi:uncharacterized protein DS421_15g510360 [Arachis hypogaea]|nr:uncharacterized protein DS421_15g510360 [Arachis hypogaea]